MRLVDEKTITELARIDELSRTDFLAQLLGIFRRETPKLLIALLEAVRRGDPLQVEILAHKLRSSCLGLGAVAMAERCLDLETNARAGSIEGAVDALQGLEVLMELTHVELDRWRFTLG